MSASDAIEIIKSIIEDYPDSDAVSEALNEAIKALEHKKNHEDDLK